MLFLIPANKKYKRNIVHSIFRLSFFFMPIFSSAVYSSCDMSLAVDSYPPYQTQVEGKWQGLDIELAIALSQQMKCELTIKQSPWKRSLHLLQNGRIDMMVSVSKTPQRQGFTYFVGPVRQEIVALVINTGAAIKITALADLAKLDKKIGIINGAYYGQSFTKKYEKDRQFKDQFEVSNNTQDNIKKLAARRISGFLNDPFYIADLIRKQKVTEPLSFHSFVINQDPVYFGFSKKSISEKRLLQIQRAFEQLQENGKLDSIRKKYSNVVL
jgi:polar amino acid transport system substrate-binding protein